MNIPDEHVETILQALQFYEMRMKPGAAEGWPGAELAMKAARKAYHVVRKAADEGSNIQ